MTLNEYVCPQVRVYELDEKECLLAASGSGSVSGYNLNNNPTRGFKTTIAPGLGANDGVTVTHEVCTKQNVQSLWDE